jgi:hypothetical protein
MKTAGPLEDLTILELNTMLKHIRLGQEHLRKYLKAKQFNELLSLACLDEKQKQHIASDKQEKTGNIAVILNAVITGTLGAWLGMSGYLGFKLGSIPILISILLFCTLLSGWIGYVSYKVTSKKAKDMRVIKKLRLIELRVIKIINTRRHKDIEIVANKIIDKLGQIDESLKADQGKQAEILKMLIDEKKPQTWLVELEKRLFDQFSIPASSQLERMVQTKVHKIFQAIQKLVAKLGAQQKALQSENAEVADYGFGNYAISRTFANASYIKVLTTPGLDKETVIQKPQKWIKNNVLAILTGLIPTVAGSFGSMFVFLAGTPQVMKSLGHNAIEQFLFQGHMQAIGLSIAVCLTLYYGYSYIYTNYKNFLRQKEVEKTQKLIAEENANLLKISSHYNVMTKLRAYCEELVFIQNLIKTFAD